MASVGCVGLAVWDTVYLVPRLPTGSGKHFATGVSTAIGGPAARAALTVVALGGDSWFAGPIGEDDAGGHLRSGLSAAGVEVIEAPAGTSPRSTVLVDPMGERTIVNHRPLAPSLTVPFPPADALLCDVRWPGGAAAALAAHEGPFKVLDLDLTDDDPSGLVSASSHVVASEGGLEQFTGTAEPAAGLAAIDAPWAAVTLGAGGVLIRGRPRAVAAHRIEPISTLGAGDVFHGAFALALADGMGEDAAVAFGQAAAALHCTDQPLSRANVERMIR